MTTPDLQAERALDQLRQSTDLRDDLVGQARRRADLELAALIADARQEGATVGECADALGVSRQTIYDLKERVNGR